MASTRGNPFPLPADQEQKASSHPIQDRLSRRCFTVEAKVKEKPLSSGIGVPAFRAV